MKIRFIPNAIAGPLSGLYYFLEYNVGVRIGRRDPLIPPKSPQFGGISEFKEIGEEFFQHFVNIGGLQPHERVLDVGCGKGRMALPLMKYLHDGSYEGIDIVAPFIEWCRKTYTPVYPNFHFHFADIYNKAYNPNGRYEASEYRFPFETSSFDFVFLTSVFTHMLPKDAGNYFAEITRVLKRGGRCFITYFLLNPDSLKLLKEGLSSHAFKYEFSPGCRVENDAVPESAVAYEERVIRELFQRYEVSISEPIRYGIWCGRKSGLSYQDIIVAAKTG